MNTNTNELTGTELNRAIAEALGWRVYRRAGDADYIVRKPGGSILDKPTARYKKEAWAWKYIEQHTPDWARNPGKALELCLEIGADSSYDVVISHGPFDKSYIVEFERMAKDIHIASGDTPAEALARLALTALLEASS